MASGTISQEEQYGGFLCAGAIVGEFSVAAHVLFCYIQHVCGYIAHCKRDAAWVRVRVPLNKDAAG